MSYVLIVGAKSDIAKAAAKEYATHGYDIYLAARSVSTLTNFASTLRASTHQDIQLLELDILDYGSHLEFYNHLPNKPLGVISAIGYLGDQQRSRSDFREVSRIINTNYTGIVSLFNIIANDFETRRRGFIIGLSSVAGDRGRQSNYLYGSAKAGFTAYLSGLRNRLHSSNVHVLTVKPGFVNTQMTAHLRLPTYLTNQPHNVARDIFRAHNRGKDVLYTGWMWKWIMTSIKMLPEFIHKRLHL